jgi:2-methylisocitrate lyase-like PEP mutase family enzyme
MTRQTFRSLLARPQPLLTPMAHDALSARIITDAGFEALGFSGSALLAAQYALPDLGLAGLGEMLEGARQIIRGTDLPWGADGDDGFGDVRNVVLTVRAFEAIGCGQLIFEDQNRATKRPGDGGAQTLVTAQEMQAKVRAAIATRDSTDLMIMARTDAALNDGVDEALRRAEAYLKAGADGVFVAGLQTPEQLRRVGEALRGAVQTAVVGEKRIRTWPGPAELYAMGFNQITYPGLIINRVYRALQESVADFKALAAGAKSPADMPNLEQAVDDMARTLRQQHWQDCAGAFGEA